MDTEQLKMIIDAFTAMGEAGKTAFVWWLVTTTIPGFVTSLAWAGVFGFVGMQGVRALGSFSASWSAIKLLRDELCPGRFESDFVHTGDIAAVVRAIRELQESKS